MGMQVGGQGGEDEVMMEINTTPLIDVMLVLLIMLIITIPIQTHAVKLDMPHLDAPASEVEPPPVVNLEIDFDGTVLWDGLPVATSQELELRFQRLATLDNGPEFHIRPNRLVEYKYVAGVLAAAQRQGITSIGIVGNERFLQ